MARQHAMNINQVNSSHMRNQIYFHQFCSAFSILISCLMVFFQFSFFVSVRRFLYRCTNLSVSLQSITFKAGTLMDVL